MTISELLDKAKDKIDVSKLFLLAAAEIDKEKTKDEIFATLYKEIYANHLCDSLCCKMVEHMFKDNEKGKKWTIEQTNDIARKIGVTFSSSTDDYTQYEFWCVMHMMYYDYSDVLRESGLVDPSVFGKLADAYLSDIDAPKGKLVNYFFFVHK